MSLPRTVAAILREHVTLEVECIDRMYLNAYVPGLQYESGVAAFFRRHRGQPFASSALMEPISKTFVAAIHAFVAEQGVPLVPFAKGQRKDDVMAEHLKRFTAPEGVVFVGRAQEKTPVIRTEKRRNPVTGQAYPWLVRSTAMVNHFYFYAVDGDFGPFFLKFGTYFPYTAKLCLNGHEYVKRQLAQRGIAFEALDNGILSCADPQRLQALCDGLSAETIDTFFRKWLHRFPHPFTPQDHQAGYRYALSILQAEFSLTQVLDRPLSGRLLFEDLIRENLDLGRPDRVQLIFNRRVTRQTPGRFRTRVLTDGVVPSLHVTYKHSDLKQYLKGLARAAVGRALRTELTANDTRGLRDRARADQPRRLAAGRLSGHPTSAGRPTTQPRRLDRRCHRGARAPASDRPGAAGAGVALSGPPRARAVHGARRVPAAAAGIHGAGAAAARGAVAGQGPAGAVAGPAHV